MKRVSKIAISQKFSDAFCWPKLLQLRVYVESWKSSFKNDIKIYFGVENFLRKFLFQNFLENEFEDKNEKFCSWSSQRVFGKIDFIAVWTRRLQTLVWTNESMPTTLVSPNRHNFQGYRNSLRRMSLIRKLVLISKRW